MRFEGKLNTWYAERGFGELLPEQGGEPLFVHVSGFPLDGQAPQEGERLSFEIVSRSDGRKQAVRLQRLSASKVPAQLRPARTATRPRPAPRRRRVSPLAWMALLVLGLGLGMAFWPAGDATSLAQRVSATALSGSGSGSGLGLGVPH